MTDKINNGGQAFPRPAVFTATLGLASIEQEGMTLREYAAIKLRVPESGTDWLDEMIRESVRDEFAAKAMQGMLSTDRFGTASEETIADWAYEQADAMLRARESK